MRLLRAELSRLFARRFTKIMILALVASLGLIAAVLLAQTRQPSAADLERAEARAAEARAQCEQEAEQSPNDPSLGSYCEEIKASQFLDSYALNFRTEMPDLLLLYGGLLAMFGYLVGASFLGAEWSSGNMANLLLWRTQRVRVLFGKFTALLLGLLGIGAVLGAGWVAGVWLIARFGGLLAELSPGFWRSLALDGTRSMALALLVTAGGAAVASLGRRTAAALGVLIGYLVVWEIGASIVMNVLAVRAPERFMLSSYVIGLLIKRHPIRDYRDCFEMDCEPYTFLITWPLALSLLGAVTVAAVLLAAYSFRRRDVT